MEVTERPDGVVVVNDAYNANPDSMRAALDALAAMARRGRALGRPRRDARARATAATASTPPIGAYAAGLGIDHVVAVGDGRDGAVGVGPPGEWVADADAAYALLEARAAARRRRPAQVEPRQRAAVAR